MVGVDFITFVLIIVDGVVVRVLVVEFIAGVEVTAFVEYKAGLVVIIYAVLERW